MNILDTIIETIANVTSISVDKIKSKCKREDIVLSRKLFVDYCIKYGFATSTIAEYLSYTNRGIRGLYVLSLNEDTRKLYCKYSEEIKKELGAKIHLS